MNWRQLSGRIVGLYYIVFGIFILYILSMTIGRTIFEYIKKFLLTFDVSSAGYSLSAGDFSIFVQLVLLIPAGIMLVWKLRRWAAICGVAGILVPSLTSLASEVFVSASGGPPVTELIHFEALIFAWGLFAGPPLLGIVFAWRDLH